MAGKSKGGKSKGKAQSASQSVSSELDVPVSDGATEVKPEKNGEVNGDGEASGQAVAEGGAVDGGNEEGDAAVAADVSKKPVEGELHLYPVPVKTQSGEKLELQLSPGDSVIDVKQFLLDAPETCFYTCYDLLLHTKDGSTHQLEDYNEISEVADITTGGCSLEMVAAIYDERSIRLHLRRARELLSLSCLHVSLSTYLALQQESSQAKTADAGKPANQELDGLSFIEDTAGSLGKLLTSAATEIKCMESIVFSSFNPPPSYRRLLGDLIYIDVMTLEGNKYCITGSSRSFYVNSSTGNILDPRPSKPAQEASTLVGLLQKISAKFKKGFREVLDRKASAHPFENVQALLPLTSWLGAYPIPEHKRDAARAEDSVVLSYGTELIGMQRDWNEELQSCREFPHSNPQERILRGRALYKVTCDFVDAAVKGAVGVINRCIPPINPTDPECFHMYVHNNIFFSFAVDSDVEQSTKDHKSKPQNGSGNSERVASPDLANPEGDHEDSGGAANPNVGESQGVLDNTSDASVEAPIADSEQAPPPSRLLLPSTSPPRPRAWSRRRPRPRPRACCRRRPRPRPRACSRRRPRPRPGACSRRRPPPPRPRACPLGRRCSGRGCHMSHGLLVNSLASCVCFLRLFAFLLRHFPLVWPLLGTMFLEHCERFLVRWFLAFFFVICV